MSTTTIRPNVSAQQYRALQPPVTVPTPRELFEFQAEKLREKGLDLPDKDVNRLRQLIPKEPQLFLVIPNRPDTLDLISLMRLVELNGIKGNNRLKPWRLADFVDMPRESHLLLDVEDGRERLNVNPSVSAKNIRREGRYPYSTWYGLVHGIVFPYVLQNHSLDLVGSRYKSDLVPCLYLDGGKVPDLFNRYWHEDASPKSGAPSAGSIAGV